MLSRMLHVGVKRVAPLEDHIGDPVSVHSDCGLLGCRDWESSENVVGKAANKHATVIAVSLSGHTAVRYKYSPVGW